MKITLNYIYVTIEGDYYQVCFDEKEDDGSTEITNDPYFLIQRQFEIPDGGEIYIESHDDNYIGHFKVKESILQRDKFTIEVMGKRLGKFKLELSLEKTRVLEFTRFETKNSKTFTFLGFEFRWGLSRNNKPLVKMRTAKTKFRLALAAITKWRLGNWPSYLDGDVT